MCLLIAARALLRGIPPSYQRLSSPQLPSGSAVKRPGSRGQFKFFLRGGLTPPPTTLCARLPAPRLACALRAALTGPSVRPPPLACLPPRPGPTMIVIALEGCHGCGKTELTSLFAGKGYTVLDEGFLDMSSHLLHPQTLVMELAWLVPFCKRLLRMSKLTRSFFVGHLGFQTGCNA